MLFSSLPSLATVTLPVSVFFWGWALKNSLGFAKQIAEAKAKGKKAKVPPIDLGVLSFFTTSLSSSFLLGGRSDISTIGQYAVTGSFIFVSINYLLGFSLTIKTKTIVGVYCGIFTLLFAALAYDVSTLMAT